MKIKSVYMHNVINDWFKNQFETKHSCGALAYSDREKASNLLFCAGSMDGCEREKYGYLASLDIKNDSGPSGYGSDCTIRFKKSRLKGRVTYTLGDSLGPAFYGHLKGDDAFNPSENGVCGIPDWMSQASADFYVKKIKGMHIPPDCPSDALFDYIELQYHGPLTITDVESVVLGPNHKISLDDIDKMKKMGIKVYMKNRGTDKLTEL